MMSRAVAIRAGFTMIETLIVAGAIVTLIALLLPAIAMVRAAVAKRTATQVVLQVQQAIASYCTEDARHRFPPCNSDTSLSFRGIPGPGPGPLGRLETLGLYYDGSQHRDADSRMLDPWKHPYRYALARPAPARPTPALADWNWDAAAHHELAWGSRPDPATNVVADGPLLYAYVWSLGPAGDEDDARTWIYIPDTRTR
jgi:type II secretory pathway pseudopilin PulG